MRRSLFRLSLAGILVSGPALLNINAAEAMIAAPAMGLTSEAISPIEKAGCWRNGWHGWGWYPWCGWGGPGYYGYGWGPRYYGYGWGWHRRWGWHRGWHRRWRHW